MTINEIKATNKPIALIGMMGVGKTHVGRVLAHQLDYDFIDTDHSIEQEAKQSIAEIFKHQGEQAFRMLEQAAITQALQDPAVIIATGGGCVTIPAVRKQLAAQAITIWLQSSPEEIYTRVKHKSTRPLLQTESPLQTIKDLLASRQHLYAQADITVSTESGNVDIVVTDIINRLSALPNNDKS